MYIRVEPEGGAVTPDSPKNISRDAVIPMSGSVGVNCSGLHLPNSIEEVGDCDGPTQVNSNDTLELQGLWD
jgi:hypothetical protein